MKLLQKSSRNHMKTGKSVTFAKQNVKMNF